MKVIDILRAQEEYRRLEKAKVWLWDLRQTYYDRLKPEDKEISQNDDVDRLLGREMEELIESKREIVKNKMRELEV